MPHDHRPTLTALELNVVPAYDLATVFNVHDAYQIMNTKRHKQLAYDLEAKYFFEESDHVLGYTIYVDWLVDEKDDYSPYRGLGYVANV